MSRDSQAACLDCKIHYFVGIGPYMNLMDFTKTTQEFDEWFTDHDLNFDVTSDTNKNWYKFLQQHQNHNWTFWSTDYAYIDDNGDLRLDYDNDLMEEGVGKFYFVDMTQ